MNFIWTNNIIKCQLKFVKVHTVRITSRSYSSSFSFNPFKVKFFGMGDKFDNECSFHKSAHNTHTFSQSVSQTDYINKMDWKMRANTRKIHFDMQTKIFDVLIVHIHYTRISLPASSHIFGLLPIEITHFFDDLWFLFSFLFFHNHWITKHECSSSHPWLNSLLKRCVRA